MAATTIQSDENGVVKSPKSQWSSIVKGPPVMVSNAISPAIEGQTGNFDSDWCPDSSVPEIVSSPDDSDGGVTAVKKPVWNKPSNGVFDAVSPVMGAVSWPALGESKNSPKSSSSESLKALADAPLVPALQVVTENLSSSPRKPTNANNKTPTSAQNHVAPGKQKSMKRGGGSFKQNVSAAAAGQDLVIENESPHNASGKSGNTPMESSMRDNAHVEPQKGGLGSQSNNGNDRQQQRYRRSNSGPHSRGDGSYHHGYGGKRDQDREWNQHSRSFNGRDSHAQRGYPRGYVRPAVHTPPPFIPPQMPLMRPFGNNMMYPDLPSPPVYYFQGPPPPPESLRGMAPVVGPPIPPPMYFVADPMLYARIVSQIDYYFSNDNLVKDTYLRKNMDEQGWVPVSLIAGFKKVLYLTDNIQLILDAMRASTVVEVQGDKIRRRNDWMRWLMQTPAQTGGNQDDVLDSRLQGVSLDDTTSTAQDSI
ncbi:putative la-type HTH domain, winged helix-like DNA-binding domain superfamily [Helianthus anomalus]